MAKPENGKIKFRYVEFELDSNSAALMESVKAAVALINKGAAPSRPVKGLPTATIGNGKSQPATTDESDIIEAESVEPSEPAEAGTDGGGEDKPQKNRTYPSPELLDIDLKTDVAFADFAKAKNPTDTTNKYLVCAAWLKEHRKINEVDIDHIYTCFRSVGWSTTQKDLAQPLRVGTRTKYGYFRNTSRGKYEITHVGLGIVDKMNTVPSTP